MGLKLRLNRDYPPTQRRRFALSMLPGVAVIAVIVAVTGHYFVAALMLIGAVLGLARAFRPP